MEISDTKKSAIALQIINGKLLSNNNNNNNNNTLIL